VARAIRERLGHRTPTLFSSGLGELPFHDVVRINALGAYTWVAVKTGHPDQLRGFLVEARKVDPLVPDAKKVATRVDDLAAHHRLKPAQRDLVMLAANHATHAEMCERLGVLPETLRSRVRSVLRKVRAGSLAELGARLRANKFTLPG
jgi:DNA-binding CsgD family transcriptional regulator